MNKKLNEIKKERDDFPMKVKNQCLACISLFLAVLAVVMLSWGGWGEAADEIGLTEKEQNLACDRVCSGGWSAMGFFECAHAEADCRIDCDKEDPLCLAHCVKAGNECRKELNSH